MKGTNEKKSADGTIRFSVSLPEGLLAELDAQAARRGYASRSEYVRDLIRDGIVEDKWSAAREHVIGVLTIGYDHHQHLLTQRLTEIQHHRYVNVLCATHVHLDHDHCIEAIIMKGRAPEIERISNEIGALRGVRFAKLSKASRVEL